jgi:hypothetical protein
MESACPDVLAISCLNLTFVVKLHTLKDPRPDCFAHRLIQLLPNMIWKIPVAAARLAVPSVQCGRLFILTVESSESLSSKDAYSAMPVKPSALKSSR